METLNIALPESVKHFVQARVSEDGYDSEGAYVLELIRADQERRISQARLEELLLAGLDSGMSGPITAEYWEEKKRRLAERLERNKAPKS